MSSVKGKGVSEIVTLLNKPNFEVTQLKFTFMAT